VLFPSGAGTGAGVTIAGILAELRAARISARVIYLPEPALPVAATEAAAQTKTVSEVLQDDRTTSSRPIEW
jgi:hypothetical protein